MKSERAEAYINANEMDAAYLVDKDGCGWAVIGIHQARKAVEIAEQDAEARMRRKAVQAFDDMWFSGFEPDYEYHRRNFIKKLNEI
jgi:hypothetical protein|nr:MAG TPA: hypothetical protein [Caudoviricetes sp.]